MKRIITAVLATVVSLAFASAPVLADVVWPDSDEPDSVQPWPENSDKSSGCSSSLVEKDAENTEESHLPHAVGVASVSVAATAGVVWLGRKSS
ncbi:MAG: hypothetical protein IKF14_02895 [Atopobiaceae bacterium]|nr:hypothetical protein [Atopobiaceae bacterium]